MIKPGFLIPVWHNFHEYRLTMQKDEPQVWQRVGFGLWRQHKGFTISGQPVERIPHFFYKEAADRKGSAAWGFRCGLIARLGSFWVGAHYSEYNRRWCINILPCVTLWITLKGGKVPH